MDMQETLDRFSNLLGEFGEKTALGDIQPDEDGGCRFLIDERLLVDLDVLPEEGIFYIHAALGDIMPGANEVLYRKLLENNLFGAGTGGACFGIDSDTDEIILFRGVALNGLSYEEFETVITDFAAAFDEWQERYVSKNIGVYDATEAVQDMAATGPAIKA